MSAGDTFLEVSLQKEQRLNELRTLYTIDELIEHCYDEEQKNQEAIDYIYHNQTYGKKKYIYVNGNDLLEILGGDE